MKITTSSLKGHKLRTTSSRAEILRLFIKKRHALSYSDIERVVSDTFDRVTVYRTLKSFLDHGVIHKVLDDGGALKYALCNEHCRDEKHHHDHVHFKCNICGHTRCLQDIEAPVIKLPKGYRVSEINLLMRGTCQKCQTTAV